LFKKKIIFESYFEGFISSPKPALHYIPESYKKLDRSMGTNKTTDQTVRACVPFLDALKFGYVIPFPIDYEVSYQEGNLNFNISEMIEGGPAQGHFAVESHKQGQVSEGLKHDKRTFDVVCKFLSNWKIITSPGYSCLFTQPLNQNAPFKIIDGVVDTDKFPLHINFPFYWTGDLDKKYFLKHGTPMVQVIPFKRDDWEMKLKKAPKEDYDNKLKNRIKMGNWIVDAYKNIFWSKKTYK
jgi:hypothetical protein